MLWRKKDGRAQCLVCPRTCTLGPGTEGSCCTRHYDGNAVTSTIWGRFEAIARDPIEKKPLYHCLPGTTTFSVGTAGCTMHCPFCQNAGLSQKRPDPRTPSISPEQLIDAARGSGCASIAFTYSEPILSVEYAYEVAQRGDLPVVFVTNGAATDACARLMASFLTAANVDLKTMDPDAYKRVLGNDLNSVLSTIECLLVAGVWVEITTLIVPGFNDAPSQWQAAADFVASLGGSVPWHVSAYHPAWRWDAPPTEPSVVEQAMTYGKEKGIRYVYAGNLRHIGYTDTRCDRCGTVLIARRGYRVTNTLHQGACPRCGAVLPGVGLSQG